MTRHPALLVFLCAPFPAAAAECAITQAQFEAVALQSSLGSARARFGCQGQTVTETLVDGFVLKTMRFDGVASGSGAMLRFRDDRLEAKTGVGLR